VLLPVRSSRLILPATFAASARLSLRVELREGSARFTILFGELHVLSSVVAVQ